MLSEPGVSQFSSCHFSLLVLQIKCDQYWPGRGTETYGMIQVTLLDTIELATFCVRTFSLHKVREMGADG